MTSELALATIETFKNQVIHTDLLTLCASIPRASIDMILCDLPYGTTDCSWDEIIPLEPMWAQFKRVIKPRGAIVLTASQPFTSKLVMSAVDIYKYSWYWNKSRVGNIGNAHNQPLRVIEDVCVFGSPLYFAQDVSPFSKMVNKGTRAGGSAYGKSGLGSGKDYFQEYTNWPRNILGFTSVSTPIHPTQKPVALFEYLIRTYTQPDQIVLDPCVGSGTTAIAARQTGRHFICGDRELEYVDVARERLAKPYTEPMFAA